MEEILLTVNKVRIEVRFLFGLLRIKAQRKSNFVGEASKYKIGPVRGIVRQWARIQVAAQIA